MNRPSVVRIPILALASCFFLTFPIVRWARAHQWRWTGAGFIGTLAGVFTARYMPLDPVRGLLTLAGALFISVAISDAAEEMLGTKDDQRIVIDEWVGYLASIALLPKTPLILLGGFILFRVVDTLKPIGINSFAKLPGGWGVVMDDFVGGLLVNVCLRGILCIVPYHP